MRGRVSNQWKQAREVLGLGDAFDIEGEAEYIAALKRWKELAVEARRAGNEERERELSQVKEEIKRKWEKRRGRHCPRCGSAKNWRAELCRSCWHHSKVNGNKLPEVKEYEICDEVEVPGLVPPSALRIAIEGLKEVGQSFTTSRPRQTIRGAARKLGVKVIVRALPLKNGNKFFGVWRSDGLGPEEVNRVIRERVARRGNS